MNPLGGLLARNRAGKLKLARTLGADEIARISDELVAQGAAAIEPLGELLTHTDARVPALAALERLATDANLDRFLVLLRSPDPVVVTGATKVLASSRTLDAGLLLDAVDGAGLSRGVIDPLVRAHLPRFYASSVAARLVSGSREMQQAIVRALEFSDDPNLPLALLPMIAHEDPWMRASMARFAATNPVEGTLGALEKALADSGKQVRLEAVTGLRALGARECVPALLQALKDPDLHVQVAVVGALHELADASAVPDLIALLGDDSEHVRRGAVEILNAVATAEAIEDLARALRDADWWVRVRAADALGALGGERVVRAATTLLADPDPALRRHAIEILNAAPGTDGVPALIGALTDEDWWVSERAIDALGKSGDPRAFDALRKRAKGEPRGAVLAAHAIAALGDPRGIRALGDLLESPSPEVRVAAAQALGAFRADALDAGSRVVLETARARAAGIAPPALATATPQAAPASGHSSAVLSRTTTNSSASLRGLGASGSSATHTPLPAFRGAPAATFGLDFMDLPPGQEFLDRYAIERKLGRGGYGTVYLAHDRVLGESVVLKVLNPQLSMDEEAARRFVQELKLARRIAHRGVIRIHDFLDLGGARAISMEYFVGRDLGQVIAADAPLALRRVLSIAVQVCDALGAAHAEGVVHRDIKPANVLVNDADETRLVDFGLAAARHGSDEGARLTKSDLIIGTPEYMAPEQITNETVDHRADLYALGILLYEAISGKKPYTAETPVKVLFQHLEGGATPLAEVVPGVPADVSALVASAMARDASARPADAATMSRALAAARDALPNPE